MLADAKGTAVKKGLVLLVVTLTSLICGMYLGLAGQGRPATEKMPSASGGSVEIVSYRKLSHDWLLRLAKLQSPFTEYSSVKEFRDSQERILSIEQYTDLIKHGVWLEWYENGNLKQLEKYVNGKRNGPRVTWYESGGRKSYEEFKDDRLQSGEHYDVSGQLGRPE